MEKISSFIKSEKFRKFPKKIKYEYVNKWLSEGIPRKELAKALWEITLKILVICGSPDNYKEKIIVENITDAIFPDEIGGEKSFYIMNNHPYIRGGFEKAWIPKESYINGYLGDESINNAIATKGPFDLLIFLHCPIYREDVSKALFKDQENIIRKQLSIILKPKSFTVLYPPPKEEIYLGNETLGNLLQLPLENGNGFSFYRMSK